MTNEDKSAPSVSVSYARNGTSTRANELGMRPMHERAYEKRGEQYLLIKPPPASGKSRALMFIALEFHHVSASPDNKLGLHLGQFIARDRVYIVAIPRNAMSASTRTLGNSESRSKVWLNPRARKRLAFAGGSERTRGPGCQIQEGAGAAPLNQLTGCLGEADGRRRTF